MASTYNPTPTWAPPKSPYSWGGNNFLGGDADFYRFAEGAPYMIAGNLGGAASRGLQNIYGSLDQYDAARGRALNALSPGGRSALLSSFGSRQRAMAGDIGRRNAAMLRSQGIAGADGAAMLDANNQAAQATNSYASDLFSPMGEAQSAMQAMQLSTPEAAAPILNTLLRLSPEILQRVSYYDQRAERQRKSGGGLGGILGSILGAATGGGGNLFGNLFGGLFGGGGGGDITGTQSWDNFFSGDFSK